MNFIIDHLYWLYMALLILGIGLLFEQFSGTTNTIGHRGVDEEFDDILDPSNSFLPQNIYHSQNIHHRQ